MIQPIPMANNPYTRVIDIYGRPMPKPQAQLPPIVGPKYGHLRSLDEMANEKGFSSRNQISCMMALFPMGKISQLRQLNTWYYTDGSVGGLQSLIKAQHAYRMQEIKDIARPLDKPGQAQAA